MSPKLGTPDIFPGGISSFTGTLQGDLREKKKGNKNAWKEDFRYLKHMDGHLLAVIQSLQKKDDYCFSSKKATIIKISL